MTRILIAGLGSIGRRHLRNLSALGEKDIVLLRTHRGTLPDDELAKYEVETDIQQALTKHKPAAVIVSNPTALHLEIAIPAAESGCSILLEKPVSHSLDGLDRLQAIAHKSGSRILMGFQFRYHPALIRAAQLISGRELGRTLSARVHFGEYLPTWHPWEDYRQGYAARADLGGGVLLTQCHSLDYLPWLLGQVDAVWSFLGKLSDLELDVDDTAEIGLRFDNGTLSTMHLDYSQEPPTHQVQISGTLGTLQCDLLTGTARLFRVESKRWEEFPPPKNWERNDMFMQEMTHFLAIAQGEVSPACTLEDGIQVMRLIDAVQEAHKTGHRVSLKR